MPIRQAGSLSARVSQAGRHPIAPLSVKLTIDEHYRTAAAWMGNYY